MDEEQDQWTRVPVGDDAARWATRGRCRRVLFVVHNVTSATRLLDVLPLFHDDLGVQLLATCTGSSAFRSGVADLFADTGLPALPWEQALATPVDLAISASFGGELPAIQGPLTALSHGIGYTKRLATSRSGRGPGGVRVGGARLARGGQDPCRTGRGRPDRPCGPHRPPRGGRGRGGRADDGWNAAAPLPYSCGPEHRSRKRRRYSTCWSALSSDRILIASSVSGSAAAGSSAASRISARSVRGRGRCPWSRPRTEGRPGGVRPPCGPTRGRAASSPPSGP